MIYTIVFQNNLNKIVTSYSNAKKTLFHVARIYIYELHYSVHLCHINGNLRFDQYISIFNCAVKIIFLDWITAVNFIFFPWGIWNNLWFAELPNAIVFWIHQQQNHWAWHCWRNRDVCRLILLPLTWIHMSQRLSH